MNTKDLFNTNTDRTIPPCSGGGSNDPLVDQLLGNAYHVVRTVYMNLGNLKLIYDFLNQYGMVLGVNSEEELKALTTKAKYARIYGFSRAGDRKVTDYLYVEGDRTGILPNDATATGSWITVATSSSGEVLDPSNTGAYQLVGYDAVGGETTIAVPVETIGVPFITIDGFTQLLGKGFTYNRETNSISLAQKLELGQEVILFLTGVPATPDDITVDNWKVVNWLYNYGNSVGGEQAIDIPFAFVDVPAVYKNGSRLYKGLADNSYTLDAANNRIFLTEPLSTGDRLILTIGGNEETIYVSDRTIQEVARGFNLKDSQVILDSDAVTYLNDKTVIYVTGQQKSYKLPALPTNVRVGSVVGDQLTYVPGNVVVTLVPINIL